MSYASYHKGNGENKVIDVYLSLFCCFSNQKDDDFNKQAFVSSYVASYSKDSLTKLDKNKTSYVDSNYPDVNNANIANPKKNSKNNGGAENKEDAEIILNNLPSAQIYFQCSEQNKNLGNQYQWPKYINKNNFEQ
jgi:hypothetical protein